MPNESQTSPSYDTNMDNDDATIGHIYSRREILLLAATSGVVLVAGDALAVFSQQASTGLVASPVLTEGPFFVDEKLKRSSLMGETQRSSVVKGAPLRIKVKVVKLVGSEYKPFQDAQVDLWHSDTLGVYSDVDAPMNRENTAGENWLRGYQLTDKSGDAIFDTIVPGWYMGRALHIHFKVRKHDATSNKTAELTSQMFFADSEFKELFAKAPYADNRSSRTLNTRDGIYNERTGDGSLAGAHLMLKIVQKDEGYEAQFTIVLTDKNFSTERQRGGFGGPGGRPPGRPGEFDWATF